MSYTLTGKRQEILERRKEVKRKTLEARRKYDGIVKEQELAPRVYIRKRAKVSHSCTPHAPREDPISDGPADKATVDNFDPREEALCWLCWKAGTVYRHVARAAPEASSCADGQLLTAGGIG